MMGRVQLLKAYWRNRRLDEYRDILHLALNAGYAVISLRDYAEKNYDAKRPLLVLRHDVDHDAVAARKMFEIEKEVGVRSSFYFRRKTFDATLMREIEAYGSEASLHFESVADFVKANAVRTKAQLEAVPRWKERCLRLLRCDIERFRALADLPCKTVASHGEYENVLVDTPNNVLTEDVSVYEELGIVLEAYNREMLERVSVYISDVPLEINGGYKYGTTPLDAIRRGEAFVMFLTHPCHWHYTNKRRMRKMIKVLLRGAIRTKEEFKRL
jgi:hypothetical protein